MITKPPQSQAEAEQALADFGAAIQRLGSPEHREDHFEPRVELGRAYLVRSPVNVSQSHERPAFKRG